MFHCPVLVFLTLLAFTSTTCSQSIIAELEYGTFKGVHDVEYNVTLYRRIPFAAPPVGENRFRAPQPPLNITTGIYDSNQSFDPCPASVSYIVANFCRYYSDLCIYITVLTFAATPTHRFRRLSISITLLTTMERNSTTPPSCRLFLRWWLYPRRWFSITSPIWLPHPQCLNFKQFRNGLSKLPY
jgi:hypothetical protein